MMVERALDTKGSRVKYLRNLTNLERQDFCKQSGINFHTYKSWELNKMSGITEKGCQEVIRFIALRGVTASVEWIMEGRGEGPTLTSSKGSISTPNDLQQLVILDDSMEPLVAKGGKVFFKKNKVSLNNLEIGRLYVVNFDATLICRILQKNDLFCSYKKSPSVKNAIFSKDLVSEVFIVARIINE